MSFFAITTKMKLTEKKKKIIEMCGSDRVNGETHYYFFANCSLLDDDYTVADIFFKLNIIIAYICERKNWK